MIEIIDDDRFEFDRRITMSDWYYSASVLGIIRFLNFNEKKYKIDDDQSLLYNYEDINLGCRGKYIEFVEEYFGEKLKSKALYEKLASEIDNKNREFSGKQSKDREKEINEYIKYNTISKKIFKEVKYPQNSLEEIMNIYLENSEQLIRETFKNSKHYGYNKFLNESCMDKDEGQISRILGYYIDLRRKSKTLNYGWYPNTYFCPDHIEFNYIPFAFTKTVEAFFINNNYTIEDLVKINDKLNSQIDRKTKARKELFFNLNFGSDAINNNVEIIKKIPDTNYYETIHLRSRAIETFKEINIEIEKEREKNIAINNPRMNTSNKLLIETNMEKTLNAYIKEHELDVMQIVTEHIVEDLHLDSLINLLLKENKYFLVTNLIKINEQIYRGGSNMWNKSMKGAYAAGKQIVEKFKGDRNNKIRSYREKLVSCLILKDYDRFNEILLQLSSYAEVKLDFAYDLFDDFESNKNVAYTFVNSLVKFNDETKKGDVKSEK